MAKATQSDIASAISRMVRRAKAGQGREMVRLERDTAAELLDRLYQQILGTKESA